MKKFLIIFTCFIYIFPSPIKAQTQIIEEAKNVILIEATTGDILYEKNSHERHAPASMTKMMSLLLVMEQIDNGNLKWDEIITASAHASSMGGSQIYLQTGEQMTVTDLIKGVTMSSANDAIVALAERVGGTEDNFVELMNKKSTELGLENTNFKNATGLDEANHYSTAYDMAIIAKELVKHEKILEYSSVYEDYIREDTENKFWLVNTNKLVRYYPGVDGLKTGYTAEAGYCLTATANKNSMRLIGVVMGNETSNSRNEEMMKLLDYGYNTYKLDNLFTTNTIIEEITIDKANQDNIEVYPQEEYNILNNTLNNNRDITYKLILDDIKVPLSENSVIGKIEILENMNVIDTVPAIIKTNINKTNLFNLFYEYISKIFSGNL